jgi:hypothetical protein
VQAAANGTATKAFKDDVSFLLGLILNNSSMGLESFFKKLSMPSESASWEVGLHVGETRAEAYARALDGAVHDAERFPRIFDALKSDPAIKKSDVISIANMIVFKMPARTSKEEALEYIWKRHETSESTAMKVRSISGKSAA